MTIFSTPDQLQKIKSILFTCFRLPFSRDTIPGDVMEAVTAHVRDGIVLSTYDFVDVIDAEEQCGWQVKSTKEETPVTWKRAKIPDKQELIRASHVSEQDLQALGDSIIHFCNEHAERSLAQYGLNEIGYFRLIMHRDRTATYFERRLCTRTQPLIFNPNDFIWRWSNQKKTTKKEQLSALHGFHRATGEKWWAWHGNGENQLHFSGERNWWPRGMGSEQYLNFRLPTQSEKLEWNDFIAMLDELELST